jgi:hypothetical protein
LRVATRVLAFFLMLAGAALVYRGSGPTCAVAYTPAGIVPLVGAGLLLGSILLTFRSTTRLGFAVLGTGTLVWQLLIQRPPKGAAPCPKPCLLLGVLFLMVYASVRGERGPGRQVSPTLFLFLALVQLVAGLVAWVRGGLLM